MQTEAGADEHGLARPASPEDLEKGQYVCVLNSVGEHLTCGMLEDSAWRGTTPIRVSWLPDASDDVGPFKVIDVCLPYVLVTDAERKHRMLDVRRERLAVVSERFGRKMRKRMRRDAKCRLPTLDSLRI